MYFCDGQGDTAGVEMVDGRVVTYEDDMQPSFQQLHTNQYAVEGDTAGMNYMGGQYSDWLADSVPRLARL